MSKTEREIQDRTESIRNVMRIVAEAQNEERIPVESLRGSLRFIGDIIEPLDEWDCEK